MRRRKRRSAALLHAQAHGKGSSLTVFPSQQITDGLLMVRLPVLVEVWEGCRRRHTMSRLILKRQPVVSLIVIVFWLFFNKKGFARSLSCRRTFSRIKGWKLGTTTTGWLRTVHTESLVFWHQYNCARVQLDDGSMLRLSRWDEKWLLFLAYLFVQGPLFFFVECAIGRTASSDRCCLQARWSAFETMLNLVKVRLPYPMILKCVAVFDIRLFKELSDIRVAHHKLSSQVLVLIVLLILCRGEIPNPAKLCTLANEGLCSSSAHKNTHSLQTQRLNRIVWWFCANFEDLAFSGQGQYPLLPLLRHICVLSLSHRLHYCQETPKCSWFGCYCWTLCTYSFVSPLLWLTTFHLQQHPLMYLKASESYDGRVLWGEKES